MRNVSTPIGAAWSGAMCESTRLLLGTFVSIGVGGLERAQAEAAIVKGFAAIERVHSLMSFHSADSDVARINGAVPAQPVPIAPETFAVLELARKVSQASSGVFDVTMAPLLVDNGNLPAPLRAPDPEARWSDVVLEAPDVVSLRRPLWIDLGGIAKGYAVDLAASAMALPETASWYVNAGGDLRVGGPTMHPVALEVPDFHAAEFHAAEFETSARETPARPFIELENGSLASSAAGANRRHFFGHEPASVVAPAFVSVVARQCAIADALTKVVLARGRQAAAVLAAFDASAYLYSPSEGWWMSGGELE